MKDENDTMIPAPTSILITNIRLIGDVVLSTPLIGLLKSAYPAAAIDLLVNRGTGEFLEKDPRVRQVLYSSQGEGKFAGGRRKGYLSTIFRNYDLAIALNAADRGSIAVILSGTRRRVGFIHGAGTVKNLLKRLAFTNSLPYAEDSHIVSVCRDVARQLGIAATPLTVEIFRDNLDRQAVAAALGSTSGVGGYFVIHPFARWRYKYWDIGRFVEISDRLAREFALQPVWTSAPDPQEMALLHQAAEGCSVAPTLITGTLTLNQMACLIDGGRLYIGLDTAITHIAASTGTPMVALYGPTEIWRWHPWNNTADPTPHIRPGYRGPVRIGQIVALQAACDHAPCVRPHCYDTIENPCMMEITAADVYREAVQLLSRAPSEGDAHVG